MRRQSASTSVIEPPIAIRPLVNIGSRIIVETLLTITI